MAVGSLEAIQQVDPGDEVLAADPDTGAWQPRTVLAQWSAIDHGEMATIVLDDGSQVTATDHHRFWVDSSGAWVEAENLQPGDLLLTPDGVTTVTTVDLADPTSTLVWELTVETDHAFTVNTGTTNVLVHNGDPRCGPEDVLSDQALDRPEPLRPEEINFINGEWKPARDEYLNRWESVDYQAEYPWMDNETLSLLRKADNAVASHMTPDDLAAVLKDERGVRIRKPDGTPYDHLTEWDNARGSVVNAITELQDRLDQSKPGHPEAGTPEHDLFQEKLSDLSSVLDTYKSGIL